MRKRAAPFVVFSLAALFAAATVFTPTTYAVNPPALNAVTAPSSCGVKLDWTQDPADVAVNFSYDVKIGIESWNGPIQLTEHCPLTGGCTLTHVFDSSAAGGGIRPEMSYGFRLYSRVSGQATAGPSASLFATTPAVPGAPVPPTDVHFIGYTGGNPTFGWTAGSSDPVYSGYRVLREHWNGSAWVDDAIGGNTFTLGTFTGNVSRFSDWGDYDLSYRYRAQTWQSGQYCPAVNDASTSGDYWVNFSPSYSNAVEIPQEVPTMTLSATQQSTPNEYKFSWGASDRATGYELQVSPGDTRWYGESGAASSDVERTYGAGVTAPSETWTFTDGETVYFRVRALWSDGTQSSYSVWQASSFIVGRIAPSSFQARILYSSAAGRTGRVLLTWDDSAISYTHTARIYRRLVDDAWSSTPLTELGGPSCLASAPPITYTDASVSVGKRYEYKVAFGVYGSCPPVSGGSGTMSDESFSAAIPVNFDVRYVFQGAAWASTQPGYGIEWVKFNSDDYGGSAVPPTFSAGKYSVQVDNSGVLSGLAWAGPLYGWLSFNQNDLSGCPSGVCEARVNLDGASADYGHFSGWARFINRVSGTNWTDWSGWVHLQNNGGVMYGPYLADMSSSITPLEGFAWGDSVGGFVSFNCSNAGGDCSTSDYKVEAVRANTPPSVTAGSGIVVAPNWCETANNVELIVNWSHGDVDPSAAAGGTVTAANVRFVDGGSVTYESGVHPDGWSDGDERLTVTGSNGTYKLYNPLGYGGSTYSDTPLLRGTVYDVQVQVSDGFDFSPWTSVGNATMAGYYYPLADFTFTPSPVTGPIVQFGDASTDRSLGAHPVSSYQWAATGASSNSNPNDSHTTVVYTTFANNPDIQLTVGDGIESCTVMGNIADGSTGAPTPPGGGPAATGGVKRRIFRER